MYATLKTLSHFDQAPVAHLKLEPEQERFIDPWNLVFSELQANSPQPGAPIFNRCPPSDCWLLCSA